MLLVTSPLYAVESDNKSFSPRLKFKNGPVCMCSDGLSEKDIKVGSKLEQASGENGSVENSQQLETSQNRDTEDK
jgi:hypothetical protein